MRLCVFVLALVNCLARDNSETNKPCTGIPLINAAWRALPAEQRFPCDAEHLVVIHSYATFLHEHPGIDADQVLREKGRHAFAFILAGEWPIYINLDGHRPLTDAFRGRPWMAYAIAGVLAHERCHALGNPSEAAGLRAELVLDQRFVNEAKLPPEFDLHGMALQVQEQERNEWTTAARQPSPLYRR